MGYTHYWRNREAVDAATWAAIRNDAEAILNAAGGRCGVTWRVTDDAVEIDGQCEAFIFPGRSGFNFCKTRMRPYDELVTAILAAATARSANAFGVSSDGGAGDWIQGLRLAEQVTGLVLPVPPGVRDPGEGGW